LPVLYGENLDVYHACFPATWMAYVVWRNMKNA